MYTFNTMFFTAPPESQLILMDGDPPPVVLKSEKDEIDIFFCPDPSSGHGGLHAAAAPDSSDDEVSSSSTVVIKPSTSSRSTTSKKRTFGSAQRNLSKAFDDVPCDEEGVASINNINKARSNLFGTFNASIKRESKALEHVDNDEDDEEEAEEEETTTEEEDIPKPFRASAINTQKDLMLLNGDANGTGSEESDQLANDVKLALFSPLKSQCGSAQKWEIPDIGSFSPSFLLGSSDDRFFQLEPDADYNFSLNDSEGIADLFDYKI